MPLPDDFGIPPSALTRVIVPSIIDRIRHAEADILRRMTDHQYSEEDTFAIKLALEEALINAMRHGNRGDPAKFVELRYFVGNDRIVLSILDQGEGFDPGQLPDPTSDENLDKPSGRGVMLIRAYMTDVRFCGRGNEIWMMRSVGKAG